ncbi:hypothetical protein [Microbacterium sp. B24]|uniref:hypothetical protein n=1 Tax=Microbacterium sp. B24 TaxID=95616 RepID=UPI001EF9CD7E|nr:hypothetical protein [Microbacterium sp. B24]
MSVDTTPQLRFRLPGEWIAVDPRDEQAAREHSAVIARELVGAADDAVLTRRRVQRGFDEAAAAAREASAHLLLMCREIAPRIPTPVTITVHTPITITPSASRAGRSRGPSSGARCTDAS